ncbi:hypothetical protein TNCV_4358471 [Trichonephila clavipes]|nr:hypothetical protein TNCV_4358471 [Trichonephila clavipes]
MFQRSVLQKAVVSENSAFKKEREKFSQEIPTINLLSGADGVVKLPGIAPILRVDDGRGPPCCCWSRC